MVIKSLGIFTKIISLISISIMLILICFFIWVVTGPRSLSAITPYVENELNNISPKFNVDIEESFIKWDGFQHALSIYITNVKLTNDTNEKIATFPKASFEFNLFKFLKGQILSSDLTLIEPSLYISLSKKILYVTPEGEERFQNEFLENIHKALTSSDLKLPINSIRVRDASLFFNNGTSEMVWKIKEGYTKIESENGLNKLLAELNINFGNIETYLKSEFTEGVNEQINVKLTFKDLPSYGISDSLPNIKQLRKLNVKAAGKADFSIKKSGEIPKLTLIIDEANGKANIESIFEKEFDIKNIAGKFIFYNNFSELNLEELLIDFNGPLFTLNANVKNNADFPEFDPSFDATLNISNLHVDNVKKYWPKDLGLKARDWVTTNIADGLVKTATGEFKFTSEDFKKIKAWKEEKQKDINFSQPIPLPEDSIKATVKVENTKVNYHKNFPPATDVNATVEFTAKSMFAKIDSGKTIDSHITGGMVSFNDMWQRPMIIDIETDFKGKASDAISFLEIYKDNFPKNNSLQSIYDSEGKVEGNVKISLPIKKHLKYDEISLNISGEFSETTLPSFINGKDVKDSNFKVTYDKNKLYAEGRGNINDRDIAISYTKLFSQSPEFDSKYSIKGDVSSVYLKELDLADVPFLDKDYFLDIQITEKGNNKDVKGSVNVKNTHVYIPAIGFDKPTGKDGIITFEATHEPDGSINIENFDATGENFNAHGKMIIKDKKISSIDLSKVKFARNDFKAKYKAESDSILLDLKGNGLDFSKIAISKALNNSDDSKKNLDIKIDIDNLHMKNDKLITDFSANVDCSTKLCSSVNAYGKLANDKFVVLSLRPIADRSSLMVESDDAGELIAALGISKHIKGGRLTVESTFADVNDTNTAKGVVIIRDFTAIRTPILGKLLTLASLKGIEDLLNQKGITFKKFDAPFLMSGGVITVKDAKTSGASVGITSSGTIDNNTGQIDLKGAIVPAYEMNKMLGKIPVVGSLIIGKKNEGLIATKYRIKGPYEDAKITVNPLTILTPGFLRNIFDILPGE